MRDKMLYASGFLPICVQAAAEVIPELIPVPSVPNPVHNAADKNIMPLIGLSIVVDGTTKSRVIAIIKQKMIGVSIRASLIKVNVSNLSYALVFFPKAVIAAFEKVLNPIAGPMLPIPTHSPLAIRRKLSVIVVMKYDWL